MTSNLHVRVLRFGAAEQRAAHEEGEEATGRAAGKMGTVMVVSSSSTTCLEDVAAAGGPSMKRWLQLSLSSRKVDEIVAYLRGKVPLCSIH